MQQTITRRLAIAAGIVLFIVALGPLLWATFVHSQGSQIGASLIGEVKNAIGLNPWQQKFLVAVLGLVGALAVYLMFSFAMKRQVAGFLLLGAMNAATYGFLWQKTAEHWFASDGTPLKCYVLEAKKIRVRDIIPVDPDTGRPCKAVNTPELRARLQAWLDASAQSADVELKPIARPSRFFSTFIEGEAIVWYFRRSDGTVEFFDLPGFHPVYSAELQPVTRAVVEETERLAAQDARSAALRDAEQRDSVLRSRYLTGAVQSDAVVFATANLDSPFQSAAMEALASKGRVVALDSNFVSDGLFDAVWKGDYSAISRFKLSNSRLVALVRSKSVARVERTAELENFTLMRQDFSVLYLRPSQLHPEFRSFTVSGRGFSDSAAQAAMQQDFAVKFRASMSAL